MSNDDKMVELMSLMLDELREVKSGVRGVEHEIKILQTDIRNLQVDVKGLQSEMKEVNHTLVSVDARLGALEYALLHDTNELRTRIERMESKFALLESNR